jgi:hypothetical protein
MANNTLVSISSMVAVAAVVVIFDLAVVPAAIVLGTGLIVGGAYSAYEIYTGRDPVGTMGLGEMFE